MSRTARLWKGIGSLTLGGILLSGGIAAGAADSPSLSQQLVDLGRQAAARGKVDDARTFYQNALRLDPSNPAAKAALGRLSNVRRIAFQDPALTPPAPAPAPAPATESAVEAPAPGAPVASPLERQAQLANVQREAFVTEVRQRMQAARDLTNARNPEAALAALRDALTVVQSADNIPEDSRRRLENEVRNAIGATERLEERIALEQAEQYRISASQAARSNAVERLVRSPGDLEHPDDRVRQPDGRGLSPCLRQRRPGRHRHHSPAVRRRPLPRPGRPGHQPLRPGPLGGDVRLGHDRLLQPCRSSTTGSRNIGRC